MRNPVPYNVDLERPTAQEDRVNEALKSTFHKIIAATHRDLGHASRGVHARSHALLEGTLSVHAGLSPDLAQGLFAQPGAYKVIARLSAIPGDPLPNSVSGPRGLALKILDVPGVLLDEAKGEPVQDILFANGAAFGTRDAKGFLSTLRILALTTDRAEGAKALLSRILRRVQGVLSRYAASVPLLDALGGFLPTHPLGDRFFTQVPLRYGDYVAKFDIVPESESFRRLTGRLVDIDRDPLALRHAIARVLAQEGGRWTLRVQLCRDIDAQPVEDATRVWSEDISPFQPVATIDLPAQASWNKGKAQQLEDALCFAPWQGLAAHRPLGNIMRARRAAYPFSSALRGKLNGCPIRIFPR